ncbi:MAG: biotin/lipoyl-binding protein [Gammaproteobacteria bacterium]|nr:biotin/lipoyl-binding protein [Gammaproteobacteria bacterium]
MKFFKFSKNNAAVNTAAKAGSAVKHSYPGRFFRALGKTGKVVCMFIGLIGVLFLLGVTGGAQSQGQAEIAPIPVSAISANPVQAAPEVTVYGRVENPNTTTIEAATLAYVEEVFVREGQAVKAGDVLIQLDPRDASLLVQRSQANLLQAQSALSQLQAQHTADRRNLESHRELFALTQRKEQRYETLYASGQLSLTALEELKQQRLNQEITLTNMSLTIDNHEAALAAAQARVENASADYNQAMLNHERLTIRAPFSGRITQLNAAIGRRVAAGQPVITMFDEMNHQVRVSLPADTARQIELALDSGNDVRADAKINGEWVPMEFLEVGAEVRTGRAGTDVMLAMADSRTIALGRALEVRVTLPVKHGVYQVPVQSVYGDQFIYTVENDALKAVSIDRVGSIEDELGNMHILVTAELTDGSPIVTSTLSRATTGTRVSIIGASESVVEETDLSGAIAQTSLN